MWKTANKLIPITARSTNTLNKKTGIVIFVGKAARFVMSDIPIAPIAMPQNAKLLPAK